MEIIADLVADEFGGAPAPAGGELKVLTWLDTGERNFKDAFPDKKDFVQRFNDCFKTSDSVSSDEIRNRLNYIYCWFFIVGAFDTILTKHPTFDGFFESGFDATVTCEGLYVFGKARDLARGIDFDIRAAFCLPSYNDFVAQKIDSFNDFHNRGCVRMLIGGQGKILTTRFVLMKDLFKREWKDSIDSLFDSFAQQNNLTAI